MKYKILVILGSSRDNSNTLKALKAELPFKDYEIIELHNKNIGHYNYKQTPVDDFMPIAERMVAADTIVFATPVYWYAMSAHLKIFFDRITDLVTTSKKMGRSLKGKKVYLFATGTEATLPEGFEIPFSRTSDYLDMDYQKAFYVCTRDWDES